MREQIQIKIVLIGISLLLTNTLVWSSEGVWEIVLKSTYQECLFSGKVYFRILREYKPSNLNEQLLQKHVKDPQKVRIELEISKQLKLNPKQEEKVLFIFDNINHRFIREGQRGSLYCKEIFTKKMRVSFTKDLSDQYSIKYSVFRDLPNYPLSWELHLLRGRFWECMAKSSILQLSKLTDNYAIILSRKIDNPKVYSEIKVDLQNSYKPVNIKTFNERKQMVLEAQISYRQQQGFLYPSKLLVKVYGYPSGRKLLLYQDIYEVEKIELNTHLQIKFLSSMTFQLVPLFKITVLILLWFTFKVIASLPTKNCSRWQEIASYSKTQDGWVTKRR
jgi:hypothetical protein